MQFDQLGWSEPSWLRNPALFDGIFMRRCIAYFLDAVLTVILAALVGFAACTLSITTLGLLGIPAFLLAAPFIHFVLAAVTIGGRHAATPGMRAMGLRVVAWTGENPGGLRGILQPAMFYMTVPTTAMVILLFAFFDPRGRCLHDHLAGVLVVRSEALPSH
ncbi:MAG TPA: RDD family protein [Dongiaceae bacterium]